MSLLSPSIVPTNLFQQPFPPGRVYPLDPIGKPVLFYLGKALLQWIRSWFFQRPSSSQDVNSEDEPTPDASADQGHASLLERMAGWLRKLWHSARALLSHLTR